MKTLMLSVLLPLLLIVFSPASSGAVIEKRYDFQKPRIATTNVVVQEGRSPEGFDVVFLPGCPLSGRPGEPAIPHFPVRLLLPQGQGIAKIEVVTSGQTRLPGKLRLAPSQPAFPLSRKESFRPASPDPGLYASHKVYPEKIRTGPTLQWCRGFCILTFELFPVRYVPDEGTVYYVDAITVRIHTKPEPRPPGIRRYRGVASDLKRIEGWVQNPGLAENYGALPLPTLAAGPFTPHPKAPEHQPFGPSLHPVEYVIITNEALAAAPGPHNFQALMDHRRERGFGCLLKTVEEIYAEFPGEKDQEKIRNFCIHAYENWNTEFVLLGGDGDSSGSGLIIPARGFYAAGEGYTTSNLKADLYYANLDGDFDFNENGLYGEIGDGPSGGEVDLMAELYVGRAPVATVEELARFVAKVLAYETSNPTLPWLEHGLFVGEFLWGNPSTWGGDYMDEIIDGCSLWGYVTVGFPEGWSKDTLYERDQSWTASHLKAYLNSNDFLLVNHLGHANTSTVMQMAYPDVDGLVNIRPFFAYSQGCYAGNFSALECMAERFVTAEGGAFGVIMNDKYGWGEVGCTDGSSQYFHRQFVDALFSEGLKEAGRANADSKEDNLWCVNYKSNRWCLYETNLFGDPATPLCGPLKGSQATVSLDRTAYKDGAAVVVSVVDTDLNTDPNAVESAQIRFESTDGDVEELWLKEWGNNAPSFRGYLILESGAPESGNGILEMAHDQAFTVTYLDEDDGFGGTFIPVIRQAKADYVAPLLSQVHVAFVDDSKVQVEWEANEPVLGIVVYGMAPPLEKTACASALSPQPAVSAEALVQCSDYLFYVKGLDAAGNESMDDNGGLYYFFSTQQRILVLDERMNEDPGWTLTGGSWQWGQPQGVAGDPLSGITGPNVYGYNLVGPYEANMAEQHLITPPLDCTGLSGTTLRFWRLLTVDGSRNDYARLAVSRDGVNWTELYENPISPYLEACWLKWSYDISAVADGQGAVFVRWTMGPTNKTVEHGGWSIDDVQVWGIATPSAAWLNHDSHRIDDGWGGNGDGIVNPGEVITFPLVLENTGLDATAPTAELKAFPGDVSVLIPQGAFPSIAHNEKGESLSPHFQFQPALGMRDGEQIIFELDWAAEGASGTTHFSEVVRSTDLVYGASSVDDAAFDGDGLLDPGETVGLAVGIHNQGSIDALNVSAHLTSSHPQYVTVTDPLANFGDVSVGDTVTSQAPHFTLAVSPTTPNYTLVTLTLSATGDNCAAEIPFTLEVTDCNPQLVWPLDTDPGWICEKDWAFGTPQGMGAAQGCPDPSSGFTGLYVYGYNLEGGYSGTGLSKYHLTSEAIDCSQWEAVKIRFKRWLGVGAYDKAVFWVSTDGVGWTKVWGSGLDSISDGQWITVAYDVSSLADHQPVLYLRWTMGPMWSVESYCGWNIDDIEIWGR